MTDVTDGGEAFNRLEVDHLPVVDDTVFAACTMDVDPTRAVNAVLVSVDAGVSVHTEWFFGKVRV